MSGHNHRNRTSMHAQPMKCKSEITNARAHLNARACVSVGLDGAEHVPAGGVHHVLQPQHGRHVREHEEGHEVALLGPVHGVPAQVVVEPDRWSGAWKLESHEQCSILMFTQVPTREFKRGRQSCLGGATDE